MTELVERLRAYVAKVHPTAHLCACGDIEQSAAEIERLTARVGELEALLHDGDALELMIAKATNVEFVQNLADAIRQHARIERPPPAAMHSIKTGTPR